MKSASWQIRLCDNPDCGLRYPFKEDRGTGERCPACLGATQVVLTYSALNEIEGRGKTTNPFQCIGLLDNIRSAWNVGSIFRTSEGLGVRHLYLCGITATPESAGLKKTALGAENSVSWSYHKNSISLGEQLIKEGYLLWALETSPGAKPASLMKNHADSARRSQGIVLVVGNEEAGVDPGVLDLCHEIYYLPMQGKKKSFNVSVAYGIAIGMMSLLNSKSEK